MIIQNTLIHYSSLFRKVFRMLFTFIVIRKVRIIVCCKCFLMTHYLILDEFVIFRTGIYSFEQRTNLHPRSHCHYNCHILAYCHMLLRTNYNWLKLFRSLKEIRYSPTMSSFVLCEGGRDVKYYLFDKFEKP